MQEIRKNDVSKEDFILRNIYLKIARIFEYFQKTFI